MAPASMKQHAPLIVGALFVAGMVYLSSSGIVTVVRAQRPPPPARAAGVHSHGIDRARVLALLWWGVL